MFSETTTTSKQANKYTQRCLYTLYFMFLMEAIGNRLLYGGMFHKGHITQFNMIDMTLVLVALLTNDDHTEWRNNKIYGTRYQWWNSVFLCPEWRNQGVNRKLLSILAKHIHNYFVTWIWCVIEQRWLCSIKYGDSPNIPSTQSEDTRRFPLKDTSEIPIQSCFETFSDPLPSHSGHAH